MTDLPPMKPNPGGQIAVDAILGRDTLIAQMWEILEGRSIYMNDVRRIGKTQIMVKMHAQHSVAWTTVKTDLGGIHTAAEFATEAYRHSFDALNSRQKALRRMQEFAKGARGIEIAKVIKLPDGSPAPWQEVLQRTFADVNEAMRELGAHHRIVFFWDEVPFMLDNIAKREGATVAMEVLDKLRALSQDHDRVRLVLTGSIGLHHVLKGFQNSGYNGSPLNRMDLIQPGPLAPEDGAALAEALLRGAEILCEDLTSCANTVATGVGNVAFYIHKLISRLPRREPATPGSILATLDREITSDNNDWDLKHYRDRLRTYYGDDERLSLAVLDAVAVGGTLSFAEIRKQISAQMPVDDEKLRDLLKLLSQDHYLTRTPENAYRFHLDLIARWWRLDRSLA